MKFGNFIILKQNDILQEELYEILRGFKDISKNNVSVLVRYIKGEYIVWLDRENEFDWETTDAYDEKNKEQQANRGKYIAKIGALQHQPIANCISKQQYKDLNYMLAEAVVLALENDFEECGKHIAETVKYLEKRSYEVTRKWQLLYCFFILALTGLLFIISSHYSVGILEWLNVTRENIDIIKYSLLGMVGATLSIIQKSGKKHYDCESGKWLNFLEIFSRMFASVISSFVIIYLYKMDVIFANFQFQQEMDCLVIICIIAGFSERLVPSLISKFENNEIKEEEVND